MPQASGTGSWSQQPSCVDIEHFVVDVRGDAEVVVAHAQLLAAELAQRLDARALEAGLAVGVVHDDLLRGTAVLAVVVGRALLGAHRALEHVVDPKTTHARLVRVRLHALELGVDAPRVVLAVTRRRFVFVRVHAEQVVAAERREGDELALGGLHVTVVTRRPDVALGASHKQQGHERGGDAETWAQDVADGRSELRHVQQPASWHRGLARVNPARAVVEDRKTRGGRGVASTVKPVARSATYTGSVLPTLSISARLGFDRRLYRRLSTGTIADAVSTPRSLPHFDPPSRFPHVHPFRFPSLAHVARMGTRPRHMPCTDRESAHGLQRRSLRAFGLLGSRSKPCSGSLAAGNVGNHPATCLGPIDPTLSPPACAKTAGEPCAFSRRRSLRSR